MGFLGVSEDVKGLGSGMYQGEGAETKVSKVSGGVFVAATVSFDVSWVFRGLPVYRLQKTYQKVELFILHFRLCGIWSPQSSWLSSLSLDGSTLIR